MTSALILAAGEVQSEGRRKPVDAIGGISSIRRLISVFVQAGIKKIIVVSGYEAAVLERHCAHMGVIFLRNKDYKTGDMLSSAKIGIRYLKGKCQRTFISPVNFPFFSDKTIKSMTSADEPIVIPMYNNKTGHPLLLSESLFDMVLDYEGPSGLEGALSGADVSRRFLDVPDAGILIDMRTDTNMSDMLENHSLREIRPDARILLSGEKVFFSPETLHLLTLTDESGSLKYAASQMGISYSKAWQLITDIETQLGFSVLDSRQGGRNGGGSVITDKGMEFISRYEVFLSECVDTINTIFGKYFKEE